MVRPTVRPSLRCDLRDFILGCCTLRRLRWAGASDPVSTTIWGGGAFSRAAEPCAIWSGVGLPCALASSYLTYQILGHLLWIDDNIPWLRALQQTGLPCFSNETCSDAMRCGRIIAHEQMREVENSIRKLSQGRVQTSGSQRSENRPCAMSTQLHLSKGFKVHVAVVSVRHYLDLSRHQRRGLRGGQGHLVRWIQLDSGGDETNACTHGTACIFGETTHYFACQRNVRYETAESTLSVASRSSGTDPSSAEQSTPIRAAQQEGPSSRSTHERHGKNTRRMMSVRTGVIVRSSGRPLPR